jgi:hypothetical protein
MSLEIIDRQVLAVTMRRGKAGNASWALLRRPLNDLGFTTANDGLVIHGHPYFGDMLGQLLLTGNGGRTWHVVRF